MVGRPSNKIPSEMGARIASLRRQAGLSQAQLAEALGIPQRTISFYEREAGDIPAGLAPPMARALGVLVDELLGETEKKRRTARGRQSGGVACLKRPPNSHARNRRRLRL